MFDEFNLSTPVAFFIYNRPEHTAKVFSRISEVQPQKLFIIADGSKNKDNKEEIEEVRNIVSQVTWDCDVVRLYADANLGIKRRFVTGLNHVFDNTDEAIILEDDTLPDPSFFRFCQVLLDRYRDDSRVMEITGRNQLGVWQADKQDYHFSYNGGIWGWATWSDCWGLCDPDMELWENRSVRNRLRDLFGDSWQYNHMHRVYEEAYNERDESWSYAWTFARQINSGLSVVPSRNLVSNIGFGPEATNTTQSSSPWSGIEVYSANFPLSAPPHTIVDGDYDRAFHNIRPGRWKEHPIVYPFWKLISPFV
jgi:hypothetical protein